MNCSEGSHRVSSFDDHAVGPSCCVRNSKRARVLLTFERSRRRSRSTRQERLFGDVWKRPGLVAAGPQHHDRGRADRAQPDRRDAVSHLTSRSITASSRAEISEIITHLAFYSGWANAMSAVAVAKDVFAKRGIGADQLPAASPKLLPLDEAAEADRAMRVESAVRQCGSGRRPIHNRRPVPRPVAAP